MGGYMGIVIPHPHPLPSSKISLKVPYFHTADIYFYPLWKLKEAARLGRNRTKSTIQKTMSQYRTPLRAFEEETLPHLQHLYLVFGTFSLEKKHEWDGDISCRKKGKWKHSEKMKAGWRQHFSLQHCHLLSNLSHDSDSEATHHSSTQHNDVTRTICIRVFCKKLRTIGLKLSEVFEYQGGTLSHPNVTHLLSPMRMLPSAQHCYFATLSQQAISISLVFFYIGHCPILPDLVHIWE